MNAGSTRVDRLVVQRGLAPTRSAAARLIARGGLRVRRGGAWQVAARPGEAVDAGCAIEVADDAELRWASRGGLKLDGALDRVGIDVAGRTCLDVGQSTGGFTDVLLARGAERVVGVDVGHGQLAPRLRSHVKVDCLEGVNARGLRKGSLPFASFGLIVADLSFISLTHVLPALAPLASADLLLLVKPQFELQPRDVGKGGIVREAASYGRVEARLCAAAGTAGLDVVDWFASAIDGGDGNREFFLHARREP